MAELRVGQQVRVNDGSSREGTITRVERDGRGAVVGYDVDVGEATPYYYTDGQIEAFQRHTRMPDGHIKGAGRFGNLAKPVVRDTESSSSGWQAELFPKREDGGRDIFDIRFRW